MALTCFPLPSGGLLAVQAIIMGMTSPTTAYHEVELNFPILLLLMFMVAAVYFMKEMLGLIFTKLVVAVQSKVLLSLIFCFLGAFLAAFLDALTVTAIIITVITGFYAVYQKFTETCTDACPITYEQFKGFLRNITMHGAIGTALGGTFTLVSQPQNLLIGKIMEWDFITFTLMCLPIALPTLIVGLITCVVLEVFGKTKIVRAIGYGYTLPESCFNVLDKYVKDEMAAIDKRMAMRLGVQAFVGVCLMLMLIFHVAEVGMIGLTVVILCSAFNGVTDEHTFGEAFKGAMPFVGLLVVFFTIVAVIHDQNLFGPAISMVFALEGKNQLLALFAANGIITMVSDNVFVATVFITEVKKAYEAGSVNSREWYEKLAVIVNMGTNIPAVATPNGQAAFLFLLTSSLAALIKLSYFEMLKLAFPYFITMTTTATLAVIFLL
jgi:NhaB family Na+:H+ antiporter